MDAQFMKLPFLDIEYIDAIYGGDIKCLPPGFSTYNEYACLLSHLEALNKAKEYDIALILEDDMILVDGFEDKLNIVLKTVSKHTELLYLSIIPCKVNKLEQVGSFYIAKGQWGGFAYIVFKETIDKIIKEVEKKLYVFDKHLIMLHNNNKSFVTKPFLCYTAESFSDIRGKVVNHELTKQYI